MSERYLGVVARTEINRVANRRLSGETLRAINLRYKGFQYADVKVQHGTKKVAFDTKVAENLYAGRLMWTEPTAVERTERACWHMLNDTTLAPNTAKVLEYVRERCIEEARVEGYLHKFPKRAQLGGVHL